MRKITGREDGMKVIAVSLTDTEIAVLRRVLVNAVAVPITRDERPQHPALWDAFCTARMKLVQAMEG